MKLNAFVFSLLFLLAAPGCLDDAPDDAGLAEGAAPTSGIDGADPTTVLTFEGTWSLITSFAAPDGSVQTDYWNLEDGDQEIPVSRNATRIEYRVEWDNLDQNPAEWVACLSLGSVYVACDQGYSPLVVVLDGENATKGTYRPHFFVAQQEPTPVGFDAELEARWTAGVTYGGVAT